MATGYRLVSAAEKDLIEIWIILHESGGFHRLKNMQRKSKVAFRQL
jgi:hypothetical protein